MKVTFASTNARQVPRKMFALSITPIAKESVAIPCTTGSRKRPSLRQNSASVWSGFWSPVRRPNSSVSRFEMENGGGENSCPCVNSSKYRPWYCITAPSLRSRTRCKRCRTSPPCGDSGNRSSRSTEEAGTVSDSAAPARFRTCLPPCLNDDIDEPAGHVDHPLRLCCANVFFNTFARERQFNRLCFSDARRHLEGVAHLPVHLHDEREGVVRHKRLIVAGPLRAVDGVLVPDNFPKFFREMRRERSKYLEVLLVRTFGDRASGFDLVLRHHKR